MSKKSRRRNRGESGGDDDGDQCPHRQPEYTPFHDRTILSVIRAFPVGVKPDKVNRWISYATARMVIDLGNIAKGKARGLRYRLESTTITSIPSGRREFNIQITMIALWLPMPRGWRPDGGGASDEEEEPPWYPAKPSRN